MQDKEQEAFFSSPASHRPAQNAVEEGEIFTASSSGVYFRNVGCGSISIVAWAAFNCYCFVILGNHPHCHSIVDKAEVAGGVIAKEITGLLGIIGVSTALDALSYHAACTVWWSFLATVVIIVTASIRKPEHGLYVLGHASLNNPGFAAGILVASFAGTSAFLPVILEMRNPRENKKPLHLCMMLVAASYWRSSASQKVKMGSYGVALFGLIASGMLYLHVRSSTLFLPCSLSDTLVHWTVWFSCTTPLGALAFILASAIPFSTT
ncbi:hypothetical protein BDW66DRAFT_158143 [Aspergillus desertorum]